MNTAEELDIITRMRGEVMSRQDLTGAILRLLSCLQSLSPSWCGTKTGAHGFGQAYP